MVKCRECGFLALRLRSTNRGLIEADEDFRKRGHLHAIQESQVEWHPICTKGVINLHDEIDLIRPETRLDAAKVLEGMERERSCGEFFKWRMGFSPQEHFEMQALQEQRDWQAQESRLNRWFRIIELLIAVIGVIAIVVIGLIAALIQRGLLFSPITPIFP